MCGRGGIGRRTTLRWWRGDPWKFESSRPHHISYLRCALHSVFVLLANQSDIIKHTRSGGFYVLIEAGVDHEVTVAYGLIGTFAAAI